jgi:hypothetical protein
MKPQRLASIVVSLACWIALILQGAASPGTSGSWTPAGTMLTARAGAAAVLLDDGGVLLIGGDGGDGSSGLANDVEIYRDGAGFSALAPMHAARGRHAAVRLADGRVLVTGGLTADGPASSTEIYDPVGNTWSHAGEMLEARAGHTASRLTDGRVLVAGGGSATLEIFDPASGTFASAGAMTTVRQQHAAAVLADGRVLLAGGRNGEAALASLDIYDPASGQVESGTLTGPRVAASATTLLDGTVAIVGGHDGTQDVGSIEILDPVAHTLTAAGQLATPRSGHLAFLLPRNHSVLIVGGTSGEALAANAELFLPWSGEVRPTAASVEARVASAGAALAERGGLVIAGGARDGAPLASAERFTFATIETDKDDYAPGETVWIIGEGWEPEETITLVLHEAQHADANEDREFTAVADSAGNIFSAVFAPEAHHLGVRFYLLARGRSSQAYTTFTDGEMLTSELAGAANDVTVTQGSQATFTINVNSSGNIRCVATPSNPAWAKVRTVFDISAAGVLTSSIDSTQLDFFGGANQGGPNCLTRWHGWPADYQVTATVTAAATTPVGTYTIVLSAGAGTTFVSTPPSPPPLGATLTDGTATNITVHVVAAADSTPPVITPTVSGTLGSNGWYTGDVQVSWSVTDAQSSITSSTGCDPTTISIDTTGMTLTCSATSAGGTSQQSVTVKRDATPPAATLEVSAGTSGSNGWYTSDVTVRTTGSDSTSGSVTCTADQQQTAETTGATFNGSCTNDAGLVANATPLTIKVDKTGPTATLGVSAGTAGTNGWYTSDVTVHASGDDSISGPVTCTPDQQQTEETTGAIVNGSCTNNAGLSTDAAPLTIKIDKTGPTATLGVSAGTAGTNGWYTSDVTVQTSGDDSISGPVTCTGDQQKTEETTGVIVNGSCTNNAGLSTDATALTIKIDKTGPTATLGVSAGTAGTNGWYTSDVTVHASGDDSISGPVTCTADQTQTAETIGTTFNGSCTNNAGLVTNATALTIKIDKTGPTATLGVSAGTAGANGWYTSNVTVHTSGEDSVSGLTTCTSDQQQTTETGGTTFNGSCTNGAGLVTNAAPMNVKVDKTAPTSVVQTPSGTLGLNGWYRSDVTVTTTGADSISGPVACTAPRVQNTDTTGATFNGSCTNQAGLEANAAPLTIKVDQTGPAITLLAPADAGGYILNSVVAASYACTDATSGIVACTGPVASGDALSTSPVGHYTFAVTATDQAGNSANVTHGYDVRFSTSQCLGSAGHTVLQPINVDGTSVFKQKSTIPVKFRVCDANGISVGESVVANFRLAQVTTGTVTSDVNEPVDSTTPDATFRWDPSAQQWIFNTNTKSLYANRTYGYVVTLTDGSAIAYQFGLK